MSEHDNITAAVSTSQVRRALTREELHRILGTVAAATDTRHLLHTAVGTLFDALLSESGRSLEQLPDGARIDPRDFIIPTSQWQAIVGAITGRAQEWGTAAEIGLELALGCMPSHYDDPHAPLPEVTLPDYRPLEHTVTISRDAADVIGDCETYLARLRDAYGPTSGRYQDAVHSWHRTLVAVLTMNTGPHTQISKDGPLSLFVRTSSGLVYGLIFHGDTRRCTVPGCDARIADDGTALPHHTGTPVAGHEHIGSYPARGPRPGTWSLHS